jgi:ligand-binding sensor domain-containing protein
VYLSEDKWIVYTDKNSDLPSNTISFIASDDYDRVWIGTQEGISSFDGKEWKLYKANKQKMNHYSIYIDSKDNKWIGTEKALLVLNQDGVSEQTNKLKGKTTFNTTDDINNNNTKISYFLPSATKVRIKLYTFRGEEISTIFEEKNLKGQYQFDFNTEHLSSGTYFCQFQAGESKQMQKIVVMK